MPEEWITSALQKLGGYGLKVSVQSPAPETPDMSNGYVILQRGSRSATFSIRQDQADSPALGQDPSVKPLVVRRHIEAVEAADCRKRGINFIDADGNAFVNFADVYVDVRGKRPAKANRTPAERFRVGAASRINLFSAKRSRVVFALLTWPQLMGATVREISGVAGASVGLVQATLAQLQQDEFLSKGAQSKLLRQRHLFDMWAVTYPHQLAPTLALESFRSPNFDGLELAEDVLLGGENALPELIRPSTLTLYVDEFAPHMAAANRWRRDEHPNVFLRKKFWSESLLLDLEANRSAGPRATVPSTLIYADLLASGEPRQVEAAEFLREHDDRLLRITNS